MLLSVIFLVTLLTASGIDIDTPDTYKMIRLTPYGFVYHPKTDCLAHFTFQVKACSDVHVGLFNEDGDGPFDYQIVIGGWENEKSRILDNANYVENNEHNVLDCNLRRKFWISWRNNVISAGRGDVFNNDVLMSFINQSPIQVRYIGISTGTGVSGEWKIPYKQPPLHCFQHSGWKLSPGLQGINMTQSVMWSVATDNLGQCAMTCTLSSSCMSFVHNKDRKTCQGHGQMFSDITEGQGHKQDGSDYYIKHKLAWN